MRPEAKLSPPPTRSRISSPGRAVASTNPVSRDQAIADQSLTVALRDGAQRRRDDGEVRELRGGLLDHSLGTSPCRASAQVLASTPSTSRPRQAVKSSSLPIIDVDVPREPAVHLPRPLDPADPLPQARPVVEVVRDDGAVARGGGDRLGDDLRRRLGERREDAARMEPAHAERPEEVLPVDVAGPQLRRSRVAAVGHPEGAAHAEAALGEVEPVAHRRPRSPSLGTQRISDVSTPPWRTKSSSSRPTSLSAKAVTTAVRRPKQRRRPRATLYSPPPSQTRNVRAFRMRPSPGSRRSITSPSATRSKRHSSAGRIARALTVLPLLRA